MAHLATSFTGATGLYRIFIFCSTAATSATAYVFFNFNFFSCTLSNFFKIHFDFYSQIGSSIALSTTTTLSATTKETTKSAIAKYITKLAKNIFHIHATKTATMASTTAHACMTETIVLCFFIAIAQYIIGFCSFFKLFFRCFIARVFIGVKLHCNFAIRFLYFISTGTFAYAEHFIIISFCHGLFFLFNSRWNYFPTTTFAKRINLSFI